MAKASSTTNTNNQQAIKDSITVGSQTRNVIPVISSNMLTDHSLMVKADTAEATTSTDVNTIDKPPMKDSDWLFQHNPHDGRPVYINLRTGNTSVIIPHSKPEPLRPLREKSNDSTKETESTKLRSFCKFAPHLSHNFTPWLPRSVRPREASVSRGEDKQSSEIGDMLDQWVNPVFERNETVRKTFTSSCNRTVKF